MARKPQKPVKYVQEKLVRKHRISFLLNDKEWEVVQRYIKTYRITNKSNLYRESLIRAVLKQLEEDAPTLFD